MTITPPTKTGAKPILLFNDKCGVCLRIAHWVQTAAQSNSGDASLIARPIGDDPEVLRSLNPNLNIWDAYATVHVLMPDGSMKVGGEAVAEVLRHVPKARWFAWCFAVSVFGRHPCQAVLDLAYAILADVRPLFGCDGCGTPSFWVVHLRSVIEWIKTIFNGKRRPSPTRHFSVRAATKPSSIPAGDVGQDLRA
jgi:predicted DCC family thiol-disulfide oxidoreductase YuxK